MPQLPRVSSRNSQVGTKVEDSDRYAKPQILSSKTEGLRLTFERLRLRNEELMDELNEERAEYQADSTSDALNMRERNELEERLRELRLKFDHLNDENRLYKHVIRDLTQHQRDLYVMIHQGKTVDNRERYNAKQIASKEQILDRTSKNLNLVITENEKLQQELKFIQNEEDKYLKIHKDLVEERKLLINEIVTQTDEISRLNLLKESTAGEIATAAAQFAREKERWNSEMNELRRALMSDQKFQEVRLSSLVNAKNTKSLKKDFYLLLQRIQRSRKKQYTNRVTNGNTQRDTARGVDSSRKSAPMLPSNSMANSMSRAFSRRTTSSPNYNLGNQTPQTPTGKNRSSSMFLMRKSRKSDSNDRVSSVIIGNNSSLTDEGSTDEPNVDLEDFVKRVMTSSEISVATLDTIVTLIKEFVDLRVELYSVRRELGQYKNTAATADSITIMKISRVLQDRLASINEDYTNLITQVEETRDHLIALETALQSISKVLNITNVVFPLAGMKNVRKQSQNQPPNCSEALIPCEEHEQKLKQCLGIVEDVITRKAEKNAFDKGVTKTPHLVMQKFSINRPQISGSMGSHSSPRNGKSSLGLETIADLVNQQRIGQLIMNDSLAVDLASPRNRLVDDEDNDAELPILTREFAMTNTLQLVKKHERELSRKTKKKHQKTSTLNSRLNKIKGPNSGVASSPSNKDTISNISSNNNSYSAIGNLPMVVNDNDSVY
eukprot:TRINITY_DN7419_c0_g1_i1.p1 TRINITY_DN7419_c0_g1~~TRINITY_DN7419_c0_g1_i1.p1  ORF type:complete len:722 (-),score=195.14 TRINITY_DN7419_c0_g1_i1:68-2233(-)